MKKFDHVVHILKDLDELEVQRLSLVHYIIGGRDKEHAQLLIREILRQVRERSDQLNILMKDLDEEWTPEVNLKDYLVSKGVELDQLSEDEQNSIIRSTTGRSISLTEILDEMDELEVDY